MSIKAKTVFLVVEILAVQELFEDETAPLGSRDYEYPKTLDEIREDDRRRLWLGIPSIYK